MTDWNQRLATAVADLHAQRWAPAQTTLNELIAEMIQSVDPGKNAGKAFGTVFMLRGLAEAGLGNETAAAWDWQLAQQLEGSLEQNPPSGFGVASDILGRHTLTLDPQPAGVSEDEEMRKDYAKPEPRSRPSVRYVENVRLRRWTGVVKIGLFVDETGSVSHPRIEVSAMELASVVDIAESLRGMAFEPAKLGGKPVGTRSSFTVRYELQ